eukprot:7020138-Prymnesium_polylepis.1
MPASPPLLYSMLLLSMLPGCAALPSFNIEAFGARSGGMALCTTAIQEAVSAASAAGGGLVVVPAGSFLVGSFSLASSVYLHLDEHAVLLASDS